MVNQQPQKCRAANESETQRDTVNLTAEELRSISGGHGVFLNLEIGKRTEKNGHQSPAHPHDRKR